MMQEEYMVDEKLDNSHMFLMAWGGRKQERLREETGIATDGAAITLDCLEGTTCPSNHADDAKVNEAVAL